MQIVGAAVLGSSDRVAIHGNVKKLKQQGRSLKEAIDAKPTAAYDEQWGQFGNPSLVHEAGLRGCLTRLG